MQISAQEFARYLATDVEELETRYEQEMGTKKLYMGLVLADLYAAESPERVSEHLKQLRTDRLQYRDLPINFDAYASAITCSALFRLVMIEQAKVACQLAEDELSQVSNLYIKARILATLNLLAVRSGNLERGLNLSLQTEQLATQIGDPMLISSALNSSGLVFNFSGLFTQSIDRFERARRIVENKQNHPLKKIISFNLGLSYRQSGELERALDAFQEGYAWLVETDQQHRMFIAQVEIASVLNALGRAEDALHLLAAPLARPESEHDPDTLMHAYLIQGRAEFALGEYARAMICFERGLASAIEHSNTWRRHQHELARVETLEAQGLIDQALGPTKQLVASLRVSNPNSELGAALSALARLYAAKEEYDQAYNLSLESMVIEQSQSSGTVHRKLALLEVANELERSEREKLVALAAQRELRIDAERNELFGFGGVIFFLLAIALFIFDMQRRRQRHQADQYRESSALLEEQVAERTRALEENMVHRMQAEEERRGLEQALAESDKMRSLGQLTGGVAHDFNNLLTVVTGAGEMLEHYPDMPAKERSDLIHAILEAAKSGSEINTGLLAYARRQQLNPEAIELVDFFENARQLFHQTLGEGMLLELSVAPVTILADHGQLTTAIINLLTNAREASQARGKVCISVYGDGSEDQRHAVISIQDWGRGMTINETVMAVEPFYSTKEASIASGLGLSRVYGFVQQSGGELNIDSDVGVGTTITLSFPVCEEKMHVRPVTHDLPNSARRILLVDDNEDVRSLVERMLTRLGHSVTTAESGEVALELLDAQPVDLLITDVLMPGNLSGPELATRVRKAQSTLPILMISGFAEAPDLDFPLLAKPFSLNELQSAMQAL